MRAVMLEVPQALLDERRRKGLDTSDEMWDGELHMVPPPSERHQDVAGRLYRILAPLADERGLAARFETGLFRPGVDNDWRVPDQTYTRPELRSERGIEGAASLVVEILSPNDETYDKLDWSPRSAWARCSSSTPTLGGWTRSPTGTAEWCRSNRS